jgi:hypothetical protein
LERSVAAALIHMIIPCWLRLEESFCQFRLRQNRAKQASPLVPKLRIQVPAGSTAELIERDTEEECSDESGGKTGFTISFIRGIGSSA